MVAMETPNFIERIQQARYGDSVAEILELAKAAAKSHQTLREPEFRAQWLRSAGIHPDTWSKVATLGQAEPLHQPELVSKLPANFSTLALLARFSEQELQDALAEGLVTPKLSYRALAAWRKARDEKQVERAPLLQLLPIAVAVAPDAHAVDEIAIRTAIEEALSTLSVKGQLIELQGWDRLHEQATQQWQRQRLEEARLDLNQRIAPRSVSPELLRLPLGELKDAMADLEPDQWIEVYALKNAEIALDGETKQQRYASRTRLQSMAEGHAFSAALLRDVVGIPVRSAKE